MFKNDAQAAYRPLDSILAAAWPNGRGFCSCSESWSAWNDFAGQGTCLKKDWLLNFLADEATCQFFTSNEFNAN